MCPTRRKSRTVCETPSRTCPDIGTATVTVQTERGDRTTVTFEVERIQASNKMWVGVAVVAVLLLIVIAVGIVYVGSA